jgi:hypothetical protein
MKIKVPYGFNDRVMTSGRQFGYIKSIEGTVNDKGEVKHLTYDTESVTRIRPKDVKGFELITDYKEITINSPIKMGQEVLFQNSTYGNVGILAKGIVTGIQFVLASNYAIYWYIVNGKKSVDSYNIYIDKEDFINRTKPKKELKENQRYCFTEYCIQQNNLVPVDFESETEVQAKIIDGYNRGEKMRKTLLYTSAEKFYNKMFSQI